MSLHHPSEPEALEAGAAARSRPAPTSARATSCSWRSIPTALPADARPVPRRGGRVVLAEGEVTGHAHAIRSPAATLLRAGDGAEAPRFLRATAPVDLVHEEHATIDAPRGPYAVVIQREYVPPEISLGPVPAGGRLMGGPKRPDGDELLRRMAAWGDQWRAVAGSTEPADRARAEAAIASLYARRR